MSELIIPVIKNKKVNPSFIKANSYVLKKHNLKFKGILSLETKIKILQDLWKDEFSANLNFNETVPQNICFSNKSHMLLFLLSFES